MTSAFAIPESPEITDLIEARAIFEPLNDLSVQMAIINPTPLDLLGLAQLRHDDPDLANQIAAAEGRRFDRERHEQEQTR